MNPIEITKTQIIEQLVDYEVNWFNGLNENTKKQWLKDYFLNGVRGYKSWTNSQLLEQCVACGMFLMEE